MNHNKLSRLYHEERLTVRKRGCRKRAPRTRATAPDNSISGLWHCAGTRPNRQRPGLSLHGGLGNGT